MGISSNLEVFLPEKHDPRLCSLVRKQELVQERDQDQDHEDRQRQDQKQQQQNAITVPVLPEEPLGLKLKIPSYKEVEREKEDSNDGFKTPTTSEHKIPAILPCPPAPRKPKTLPSTKRKAYRRRIVLDLSQEIESLFPTPFSVDLGDGGENKKVKLFTE
ncbi:cyclin-dependent protein kinase inhibitor SMR10-like [Gastrolobium bilobum]|uniref:cyclin-dependent protein kinase inhibitor SMR10-like n=1 Tax=Gastrolobium bilobum TaxID=150636 RepID=UPI002AB1F9F2|nr:cyclin-dependent protein kinase inhibitor SMR10-like [Gastrolobium bilobum]